MYVCEDVQKVIVFLVVEPFQPQRKKTCFYQRKNDEKTPSKI